MTLEFHGTIDTTSSESDIKNAIEGVLKKFGSKVEVYVGEGAPIPPEKPPK